MAQETRDQAQSKSFSPWFGVTSTGVAATLVSVVSRFFSSDPVILKADPIILLIEGNIGAGKSVLCKKIQDDAVHVVYESIGQEFIEAFKANPTKFAFPLQMTQLVKRQANLVLAHNRKATTILDRSIVGDFAFALWNFASDNIKALEWKLYLEQMGPHMFDDLFPLCTIVFLNDDYHSCSIRQQRRDSVPIDKSYLQGIEAAHFVVMASLPSNVSIREMQWGEYANNNVTFDSIINTNSHNRSRIDLKDRARAACEKLPIRPRNVLLKFLDNA